MGAGASLQPLEPSPDRARALDQHMRERLGSSLAIVAAFLEEREPGSAAGLAPFLVRLAEGPVEAIAFGAYFELVFAIEAEAYAELQELVESLATAAARPPELRILALDDAAAPRNWERYRRMLETEQEVPMNLEAPAPRVLHAAHQRLVAALDLLDRGAPALAGEIRALLGEVVLAAARADEGVTFDGASSFMLWGSVLLNVAGHETPLEAAQALVHESGHNLLFGLAADGPLVENDASARYDSPLRFDPRPMDGIFHAAYVCARMHYGVRELLGSGLLSGSDRDEARAALELHAKSFEQGRATIEQHARFTPVGRAVFAGARAYMESATRS